MSRRHLGGLTAAVLAGALLAVAPMGAQAGALAGGTGAGTGGGRMDPHAMASKAAAALIQDRAPELKIGKHDGFVAKQVLSSGSLNYAPYERTFRGLPVVGGDFVVVTDDEGHVLNTSVAQTSRIRLASTTPRVLKGRATTVARQQVSKVRDVEAPRLVVWQGKTSHLAWETKVSGRDHGHPSLQSVYVDARSGKYLASKEHVVDGTGTGNWEGSVTIPTSGSGSSFSMTNSNATTLRCQNASGNVTFTGTDDVWGNGVGTDRETGCVDAFYSAEKMRQMMSTWLGRNGMDGSGGWVPIRVGLNDVNAYYDGTQVQIGHRQGTQRVDRLHGRRRARVRPRRRRPYAGRHLGRWHPGVRGRHLRCRDRVVLQQPGRRSRLPRRRGDQPGRPGPDPQHVQPVGRRRPQLLLELDPEHRGARGRRSGQPLVLPAGGGHQPDQRPADQHDLQRHDADRRRASRPPSRSCTTRC